MVLVTVHSDSGAQENIVSHCFHCIPIYLPWGDGTGNINKYIFSPEGKKRRELLMFRHLARKYEMEKSNSLLPGSHKILQLWSLLPCSVEELFSCHPWEKDHVNSQSYSQFGSFLPFRFTCLPVFTHPKVSWQCYGFMNCHFHNFTLF